MRGLDKMTGALVACGLGLTTACSFMARDAQTYERDTSALLDTRGDRMQACYDAELARGGAVQGDLTLMFTVEKQTGELIGLAWDERRTSVSDELASCVVEALDGLALAQPDQRDGVATFTYGFRNPGASAAP